MSESRYENLAGARGLAAGVVFASHIVQISLLRFTGLGTATHHISSFLSEYAVLVFFVISGFLITNSLEASARGTGLPNLWIFAAARIARLYPPMLYAIGISLAIYWTMGFFHLPGRATPLGLPGDLYAARDIIAVTRADIIGALTMTQGLLDLNGPLWSLYIEAKLYVLFACAVGLLTRPRRIWLALVFYLVARSGMTKNPGFETYAAMWLIGALAYYLAGKAERPRNRIVLTVSLIAACLSAKFCLEPPTVYSVGKLSFDLLFSAAVAWLLFVRRTIVPLGSNLADFSYSLYITHFPVLLLAQSLLVSTGSKSVSFALLASGLGAVAALAIAYVGGLTEKKKSAIQKVIVRTGSAIATRVTPYLPRKSSS